MSEQVALETGLWNRLSRGAGSSVRVRWTASAGAGRGPGRCWVGTVSSPMRSQTGLVQSRRDVDDGGPDLRRDSLCRGGLSSDERHWIVVTQLVAVRGREVGDADGGVMEHERRHLASLVTSSSASVALVQRRGVPCRCRAAGGRSGCRGRGSVADRGASVLWGERRFGSEDASALGVGRGCDG